MVRTSRNCYPLCPVALMLNPCEDNVSLASKLKKYKRKVREMDGLVDLYIMLWHDSEERVHALEGALITHLDRNKLRLYLPLHPASQ